MVLMRASHLVYYCTYALKSAPPAEKVNFILPWTVVCCSTHLTTSLRAVNNLGCVSRPRVRIISDFVNVFFRIVRWRKLFVFSIMHKGQYEVVVLAL